MKNILILVFILLVYTTNQHILVTNPNESIEIVIDSSATMIEFRFLNELFNHTLNIFVSNKSSQNSQLTARFTNLNGFLMNTGELSLITLNCSHDSLSLEFSFTHIIFYSQNQTLNHLTTLEIESLTIRQLFSFKTDRITFLSSCIFSSPLNIFLFKSLTSNSFQLYSQTNTSLRRNFMQLIDDDNNTEEIDINVSTFELIHVYGLIVDDVAQHLLEIEQLS